MREVWITEAAAVTSLGHNIKDTWKRVLGGETAIKKVTRFPTHNYNASIAACINDLSCTGSRSRVHYLLDLLFKGFGPVPDRSLLITATTKSGIDNLEKFHRRIPSDLDDILPSSLSNAVTQRLGLTQKGMNISAACASSTIAISRAAALVDSGAVDVSLVCCADVVTEFAFSGFSALQILSSSPCRPFDRDRDGMSIGEGAAAFLLMDSGLARRTGHRCIATIRGWGAASDAFHITSPDREGSGLASAITQAISKAGLGEDDISSISAHGTGTVYNDLMELTAFRKVFGERNLPIYSVKGNIGHTFGAAGGVEVALATEVLSTGIVPPTAGFVNPAEGAKGRISSMPQIMKGSYMLTTNSGFGGINAALLLGKGTPH